MCKSTTPIADEFVDEELQGIGVRFTDETRKAYQFTKDDGIPVPEYKQIPEEDSDFQKRRHRVLMIFGLILTTAAMITFIEYGQISYVLAMCFNAALASVFGYNIK